MIRRCKKCGGEDFRIFDYYVEEIFISYHVECRNCNKSAIKVSGGEGYLKCIVNLEPAQSIKE